MPSPKTRCGYAKADFPSCRDSTTNFSALAPVMVFHRLLLGQCSSDRVAVRLNYRLMLCPRGPRLCGYSDSAAVPLAANNLELIHARLLAIMTWIECGSDTEIKH